LGASIHRGKMPLSAAARDVAALVAGLGWPQAGNFEPHDAPPTH
jgi:hypothetical protein